MIDAKALQAVCELVENVGDFQLKHFRSRPPGEGDEKAAREFVSEVDVRSEEKLIEGLAPMVENAGFYGEETGRRGNRDLQWIIDPLDGTTNYLSGLDQFCISVALVAVGTPVLGVVYRPASRECFSGLKGQGVWRNGEKLSPLPASFPLERALVGTGFPYRSKDLGDAFFPCCRQVLERSRGIRRFGAAALDLSYVAAGYLQGFWETDLKPYDVAAALLFLTEQGCRVTGDRGASYDPMSDRLLVAAPPGVHAQLQPLVAQHYASCLK